MIMKININIIILIMIKFGKVVNIFRELKTKNEYKLKLCLPLRFYRQDFDRQTRIPSKY